METYTGIVFWTSSHIILIELYTGMFICIFVPILKAHWITVCAEMTLTCHLSEIKATNKGNEIGVLLPQNRESDFNEPVISI